MGYRLVIGNKNTSSWSLRPWLAMRHAGIAFDEINIKLRDADTKAQILRRSPSGKVPALLVDDPAAGGFVVWDTLAILEYLAETHPEARLWPEQARAREPMPGPSARRCIRASSSCASTAPWICWRARPRPHSPTRWRPTCAASWPSGGTAGARFGAGGPFLFGAFTAADAMYAPVASRFRTYIPDLAAYGDDGTAAAYVATLFALRPCRPGRPAAQGRTLRPAGSKP